MISLKELFRDPSKLPGISRPLYDRKKISPGIFHFSVGNFHRAHLAFYTHQILHLPGQENWAICGSGIMPSDKSFADAFRGQDCLYSLTEYSPDGKKNVHVIGSIAEYLFGPEDPEWLVEHLADPAINIVSLTITEGGYNADPKKGSFNFRHPGVIHDLETPHRPETVFGYITEALRIRHNKGIMPFTVLSCDNLQHNGDVARNSIIAFAGARDIELAEWINSNVTFPNSMVDRITPAVTEEDKKWLRESNQIDDKTPVFCENFIQWVVEDNFCAGRPHWESAGVMFAHDVSDYETAKLRLLNASHSMLAYPGILSGFKMVHEAASHELIRRYLKTFMSQDVIPLIRPPKNINLGNYVEILLNRFSNPAIRDQLTRICFDGGSKLPVFLLPSLNDCLRLNRDPARFAFLFACYREYLKRNAGKDEFYRINEPGLDSGDIELIASINPHSTLKIKPFAGTDFSASPQFMEKYEDICKKLSAKTPLDLISEITDS